MSEYNIKKKGKPVNLVEISNIDTNQKNYGHYLFEKAMGKVENNYPTSPEEEIAYANIYFRDIALSADENMLTKEHADKNKIIKEVLKNGAFSVKRKDGYDMSKEEIEYIKDAVMKGYI